MASKPTDKRLINETDARDLPAPTTKSWIFYDASDPKKRVAGFGLRITSSGARSFVFNYRNAGGTERRLTIGSYPTWTVAAARAEARKHSVRVDQGEDPLAERVAERAAPTVRKLAEKAVEEHFSKRRASTRYDIYGDGVDEKTGSPIISGGQLAKWIIPTLGSLKVAEVRPADIENLHRKVTKAGSPIRANRCVATVSKMMSLAIRWGYRDNDQNPCKHAIERNPETQRKRYLKPAELARLSEALAAHQSQSAADAIRLLTFTGARRMEVLSAPWSQFDLEQKIWRKPPSSTKTSIDHEVPLSPAAMELLSRMKKNAKGEYLFPGRGVPHLTDIKSAWKAITRAAKPDEPTRLHDLRHTVASVLVSGGKTLPLIGALLGHASPTTTNRYAHLYIEPVREAADYLGAVVTSGKSAEVVPLRRGR